MPTLPTPKAARVTLPSIDRGGEGDKTSVAQNFLRLQQKMAHRFASNGLKPEFSHQFDVSGMYKDHGMTAAQKKLKMV